MKKNVETEQLRFNRLSARAAAWSAFAGIAGVFLGVVGIVIALHSLQETKRLEKLRIQPAVEFYFGDVDSSTLLWIHNSGFGPAVLKSMEFVSGSNRYEAVDRKANDDFASKVLWILGFNDLIRSTPVSEKFSVRMPSKGITLGAGSKIDIINYRGYNVGYYKVRPAIKNELDNFLLNGGNIILSYCSLDGEYCTTTKANSE